MLLLQRSEQRKREFRSMPDTIKCTHCGEKRAGLAFAPFPNELGQRIAAEICQRCWSEWLQKQTQIINHYGLDLTNPDAQTFLFDKDRKSTRLNSSHVETSYAVFCLK